MEWKGEKHFGSDSNWIDLNMMVHDACLSILSKRISQHFWESQFKEKIREEKKPLFTLNCLEIWPSYDYLKSSSLNISSKKLKLPIYIEWYSIAFHFVNVLFPFFGCFHQDHWNFIPFSRWRKKTENRQKRPSRKNVLHHSRARVAGPGAFGSKSPPFFLSIHI